MTFEERLDAVVLSLKLTAQMRRDREIAAEKREAPADRRFAELEQRFVELEQRLERVCHRPPTGPAVS